MGLQQRFRNWCPQPQTPLSTKIKHYSVPIVAVITVTLIFSVSFSIFPNLMTHPSLPQIIMPLSSSTGVNETPPAIAWVRNYTGQENADYASRIIQTSEGGYAVVGTIGAHKYSVPAGWLIKIDSQGNMEWNQTFSVTSGNLTYNLESVSGLVQTSDGGFAVAGTEAWFPSNGGIIGYTVTDNAATLFKTDSLGNVEWNQTYSQISGIASMIQTRDGGYALAGAYSLIKTTPSGDVQWYKSYEDNVFKPNIQNENLLSVFQTADGGYALLTSDNILFKVNSSGDLQWKQTYQTGASYLGQPSYISSFVQTSDRGYLLSGDLYSNNSTDHMASLIKTDSEGAVEWSKTYGSLGSSVASLIQTSDGGIAFAGTLPNSGNYPQNVIWLVKTDSIGNLQWSQTNNNTSESLTDYFLGGAFTVNSLIETEYGGFIIAGSWNPGITGLDTAYYIAKTEVVLPPPTPTSTSSVPSIQFLLYPILLGILAILVIAIVLVIIGVLTKKNGVVRVISPMGDGFKSLLHFSDTS